MSDQADLLLADLPATQERLLGIEEEVLANQKIVIERQRRALVWMLPLILLVVLTVRSLGDRDVLQPPVGIVPNVALA